MSGLTVISSDKLITILINLGFKEVRQKGSHILFQHLEAELPLFLRLRHQTELNIVH